jgi:hypothetical protein
MTANQFLAPFADPSAAQPASYTFLTATGTGMSASNATTLKFTTASGLRLQMTSSVINPYLPLSPSASNDGKLDLGASNGRWRSAYLTQLALSTSTISTDSGEQVLISNSSSTGAPIAGLAFRTGVTGLTSGDGMSIYVGDRSTGLGGAILLKESSTLGFGTNNGISIYLDSAAFQPSANAARNIGSSLLSWNDSYASGTARMAHIYTGEGLTSGTSTVRIGKVNGKGCLAIADNDGGGFTYCQTLNGTMTCNTTSCE